MLKLADHDSMSGEHVGTISGLIVTSEKSSIWPWAAPENHGFGKLRKFPREGKRPRHFCLFSPIRVPERKYLCHFVDCG